MAWKSRPRPPRRRGRRPQCALHGRDASNSGFNAPGWSRGVRQARRPSLQRREHVVDVAHVVGQNRQHPHAVARDDLDHAFVLSRISASRRGVRLMPSSSASSCSSARCPGNQMLSMNAGVSSGRRSRPVTSPPLENRGAQVDRGPLRVPISCRPVPMRQRETCNRRAKAVNRIVEEAAEIDSTQIVAAKGDAGNVT